MPKSSTSKKVLLAKGGRKPSGCTSFNRLKERSEGRPTIHTAKPVRKASGAAPAGAFDQPGDHRLQHPDRGGEGAQGDQAEEGDADDAAARHAAERDRQGPKIRFGPSVGSSP